MVVMALRHLLGLLLAVMMAAALFFGATWGFRQLTAAHAAALSSPHQLAALGAVAGTGLLLGLLAVLPWVSPLAAGLPGVVLLAWTGLAVASTRLAERYIPLRAHAFGAGFQTLLLDGILALAGLAMIVPMIVPSRWRRRGEAAEDLGDGMSLPEATGLLS